MKAVATLACGLYLAFVLASHANAQAVSSGMLSGPNAGYKKRLAAQPVASASKPRVATARRSQPDPIATGSIPAKPKN
jgi:hypothetical protein